MVICRQITLSDQREGSSLGLADWYCTSTNGLHSARSTGLLCTATSGVVIAHERPMPAVICTNSFAPVRWICSMNGLSCSNMRRFCQSHRPPMVSRTGAIPGMMRPTFCFARSRKKAAASSSKWFGSIQPNSDVPPIGQSTMRFLISTAPIFHGVNSGAYSGFIFTIACASFPHDLLCGVFRAPDGHGCRAAAR